MSHYNKLAEVVYNNRLTAWRCKVKILRIHSTLASYVESNQRNWSYIIADKDGTKTEMKIYAASEERFRGLEKQEGNLVEIFLVEVDSAYLCFKATNFPFVLTVTPLTAIRLIDPLNNRHYIEFKCIHQIPHIIPRNYPIDTMGVVFNAIYYFEDPGRPNVGFSIRENIESQIKCVPTGDHAWAFGDGFENKMCRGEVIVVLKMWRVWSISNYCDHDDIWLETEGGLSDFRFNPDMSEVEEFMQSLLNIDLYIQRHGTISQI